MVADSDDETPESGELIPHSSFTRRILYKATEKNTEVPLGLFLVYGLASLPTYTSLIKNGHERQDSI